MKKHPAISARTLILTILALPIFAFGQGTLTPPGAPAPTMKTLAQVEARTIINSTNTPGDATNSFIISAPGSYYLAGNITGVASKSGIQVSADDVTVDLNGFALIGVPSSGDGINVSGTRTNLAIRNGTVRGWAGDGIVTTGADNGRYHDLRLSANGGRGLACGPNSMVSNCAARGNSANGIQALGGSTISGCTAEANTGDGINALDGSSVSGCTALNNGTSGIVAGVGSLITACTAYANGQHGINVADSSNVNDCAVRSNGEDGIVTGFDCIVSRCAVRRNDGNGIVASTGNTVNECTVGFNGADGIVVEADCLITRNNCRQNGRLGSGSGIRVTGGSQNCIEANNATGNADIGFLLQTAGNILIRNTARANFANYAVTSGNTVGPIFPGSDPITTDNPWANLNY